jgi:hypothetical protein
MNLYRVIRDTELDVRRITKDLNARVSVSAKLVEEVGRQRKARLARAELIALVSVTVLQ